MLGVGAQGRGNTIASSPCSASSIYPWPVCHGVIAQGPAAKRRILCVLGGRAGNARFRYDDAIFTTLSVNLCFEQSIFGGPALNFWRKIWIPLLRYRPGRVSHFVLLKVHMTAGALLTVNIRGRSFMSTQAFAFCIDFLSFSLSTYLFISLSLLFFLSPQHYKSFAFILPNLSIRCDENYRPPASHPLFLKPGFPTGQLPVEFFHVQVYILNHTLALHLKQERFRSTYEDTHRVTFAFFAKHQVSKDFLEIGSASVGIDPLH